MIMGPKVAWQLMCGMVLGMGLFACAQGIQHPVGHHWGPRGALWKEWWSRKRKGPLTTSGWAEPRTTAQPPCSVNHLGNHVGGHATVSTITERTPPAKRTPTATIKERAMRTCDSRSGGAHGVDGWYNARRSGAPGPHAHGNAARQVLDDRRAEVRGQRKPSTPAHNLGTPTTGHR